MRHIHIDACQALRGITSTDVQSFPELRCISLSGFSEFIPVREAQMLGQDFLHQLGKVVQLSNAHEIQSRPFSGILSRAKVDLQANYQRPGRSSAPADGPEDRAQLLNALVVI